MQGNKERAIQFRMSLQRWGEIFRLINWLNSIMISAVAAGGKTSSASGKAPEAYRQCRDGLMSRGCALETDHFLVDSYVAAQGHDILGGGDFAAIGVRQHGPS